jgi:hypothetical protein
MCIYDRNEIEELMITPGADVKRLIAKTNEKHAEYSEGGISHDQPEGFVFTEHVVDKKTMFADDVSGNEAVVSFTNDEEVNIDDL